MVEMATLEDYRRLEDKINELTILVQAISWNVNGKQTVDVADIALLEGISKSQISAKENYLLPNFGVSEYPEGTRRWNMTTYLRWREIPAAKRKEMRTEYYANMRKEYINSEQHKQFMEIIERQERERLEKIYRDAGEEFNA